jgi:aryl-alcohol dehydrogenase-like predicted oxidoreductase
VYSHGLSEEILGRAIKQLNMPRGEIVVMTKVPSSLLLYLHPHAKFTKLKVFFTVARSYDEDTVFADVDKMGYVNQHGLSRKVSHKTERLRMRELRSL